MNEDVVLAEKKPKFWLAILCAIGMGLLGCLVWGLLYYVGYIAWIAAFLVVFAAAWGYQKLNLKLDRKGYIIISIIAVVEIILTMFITLNIACMVEFSKVGVSVGFFDCFGMMFNVIGADAELRSGVVVDAVLSLVFIGVGILCFYLTQRSKAKNLAKQIQTDSIVSEENVIDVEKEEKDK